MSKYLPCLAWTLCGIVLLAYYGPQLSEDQIEPWVWVVIGAVLILGGIQSGLEVSSGVEPAKPEAAAED